MSELPTGWVKVVLDEIAEWGSGGTPSRKNIEYYGGSIPWIKTGELGQKFINETEESITEIGLRNSSAKIFPRGSVAVAMYGATIGKTSILGIDAATNQACAVGIPKIGITTAHYLFHYLASQKETFIEAGKGGAQPNISQGVIKSWPVPLPPLPEQKRIADKLDAVLARVDACRERLDRVPGILKRFRQAVLAAATSGVLTEGWRGHEDFYACTLADIAKWSSGGTPSRSQSQYFGGGIPWVKTGELHENIITWTKETLTQEGLVQSSAKLFPKDTVLIAMYGATIGRTALLGIEATTNQACAAAIGFRDKILPEYLFYLLQAEKTNLVAKGKGGAQPNISQGMIKEHEVLIPRLQEQHEIMRRVRIFLAYADHLESRYTAARARIDRLTPSLLAKAFRGELVRQDPNDEPASQLLERISATRSAPGATRSPKKQRRPNATAPTLPNSPKSEPTDVPDAQLSIFVPEQNQTNGGVIPEENLLAALRTSVRGERSGLTESELLRGAASRLGFERLGKNIRTVLEHTLSTALHRRVVVLEDDRYVAATPTIARYDDTFLLASLAAIMRSDYEYKPDDIAEMMAGYLGYSAVTEAMRERIDGVVAEGLRVGVLAGKGGWVWREA